MESVLVHVSSHASFKVSAGVSSGTKPLQSGRKRVKQSHLQLLPSALVPPEKSETLWLCIYLPELSIEAVCKNPAQPAVVTESSANKILVYSANQSAQSQGVMPGHTLSSALALIADLNSYERSEKHEQRLLNQLATNAYYQLSSMVSLDYDSSILIEVGRSRRLWDELDDVQELVEQWLEAGQLSAELAWAPTPRSAYWLACAGLNEPVLSRSQIPAAIKSISLEHVVANKKFKNSGLTTIADIQRMPREGLVRRGGHVLLRELDQALGRAATVLNYWYPLPYFLEEQELELPSANQSLLRPLVEKLFLSLSHFLRQRQQVTRRLQLRFMHLHQSASIMTLGFTRHVSNHTDMLRIFDAQLVNQNLSADVIAIELCCRQLQTVSLKSNDFFAQHHGEESWCQMQELFDARFGQDYFQPLMCSEDHRPEYAVADNSVESAKQQRVKQRPLWLLNKAQVLTAIQGHPYWQGKLHLDSPVERIEQGWWQGQDVRRDYYVARTDMGAKVWVYRDLRLQQWFLHGFFG